ncbi:MAG TPA: adenylate/guanylate cyclase domain-containing protein [Casimicrobiaceae bacterium]|jgi:adenylate cyclase|nr:adenylate/guanylate cyclase domain-containing protein [Casimicrobiaceae bacterium]
MPNEPDPPRGDQPWLERRLATILAADVAGYSRMMGENEEVTVRTLREHRAVFDTLLKQHHGRVFNTAGDAILAEFPSAVEAVRCATEIQAALQTRNAHLPAERKMLFRMGINLGDVVVQDGDLLGDGVNVQGHWTRAP